MQRNIQDGSSDKTLMIIIAVIALLAIGYFIVDATRDNVRTDTANMTDTTLDSNAANDANTGAMPPPNTVITQTVTTTTTGTTTAFKIKVTNLPEEQQSALKLAGFTEDEIVITTAMKTCADSSIGAERTEAIGTGEKPTIAEGAKLMVCYNE